MHFLKRFLKIIGWLAAVGVVCVIGLLTFLWMQHNKTVMLPAPSGPFAVGRVEYDWLDQSRTESLLENSTTHRELAVFIWYPAAPSQQNIAPADYLPLYWSKSRNKDLGFFG